MLDRYVQNHIGRRLKTMYDTLYVRDAETERAMAERLGRLAAKLRTRDVKAG
jgi:hypothetical protein